METLRAELARAKEQARSSNAAALRAVKELRAEKAVHCESKAKMAKMAVNLKDTADRCQLLEEKNRAKAMDLGKGHDGDRGQKVGGSDGEEDQGGDEVRPGWPGHGQFSLAEVEIGVAAVDVKRVGQHASNGAAEDDDQESEA